MNIGEPLSYHPTGLRKHTHICKVMKTGILVICILSSCIASGQTFNVNIDVDGNVQGLHDILSIEDKLFCAGWNHDFGTSQYEMVVGFQEDGELLWNNNVGNPAYVHTETYLADITNGRFVLFGNQDPDPVENPNNNDILVVVLDTTGAIISENSYGRSDKAEIVRSAVYSSDTLYITGFYFDTSWAGNTEILLWSFSPTGDSLSLHTYGHPDYDFIGNKIIRAQNGDFLIAGFARGVVDRDRLLLRIAPNGDLLWYEIYEGDYYPSGSYDAFMDLLELEDGSILLAGRFSDYAQQDANLVKVSVDGEVIWDITFGGGDNDWFEAMYERNDTLFLGGNWRSDFPSGEIDAWVMALDTAGNTLWSHTYNPDGVPDNEANDYLYDFTLTSDGGMAFCGWSSRETQDAWIMKLDGNGLCDTASCFPDLVGITPQVLTGMPTPRIFPNPASDYLTIQNSVGDALTWTVYNQYGQTVLQVNTNGQQVIMDCRQLPAGVYVIQANSDRGIRFSDKLIKR
jgi:hypothetical protein